MKILYFYLSSLYLISSLHAMDEAALEEWRYICKCIKAEKEIEQACWPRDIEDDLHKYIKEAKKELEEQTIGLYQRTFNSNTLHKLYLATLMITGQLQNK